MMIRIATLLAAALSPAMAATPRESARMVSKRIETGEDFFLLFRLYGPDKSLFKKTWVLGDVERLK